MLMRNEEPPSKEKLELSLDLKPVMKEALATRTEPCVVIAGWM